MIYAIFVISIGASFSAYGWDSAPFVPLCNMSKHAKIGEIKTNLPPTIKDYSGKKNGTSDADYIETVISANIKCAYVLENSGIILYSHICPEIKNEVSFIKNDSHTLSTHTKKYEKLDKNTFKIVMNKVHRHSAPHFQSKII